MIKRVFILSIFVLSATLFAALPPKVQKRIDIQMMQKNLEYQNNSSIVLEAIVTKIEEKTPKVVDPFRAYNKTIIITIKPTSIVRNTDNIVIPDDIVISYSVYVANATVGPKVFRIRVPEKGEKYIFYLNNNLDLSANNYSIDTLDNELRNDALEVESYYTIEYAEYLIVEGDKDPSLVPKDFMFKEKLTQILKDEIQKHLKTSKNKDLELVGHTNDVKTDEYNFRLSVYKAKKVKRFLVRKLGYKEEQIKILGAGADFPVCNAFTKSKYSKPCSEINPRVTIHIKH